MRYSTGVTFFLGLDPRLTNMHITIHHMCFFPGRGLSGEIPADCSDVFAGLKKQISVFGMVIYVGACSRSSFFNFPYYYCLLQGYPLTVTQQKLRPIFFKPSKELALRTEAATTKADQPEPRRNLRLALSRSPGPCSLPPLVYRFLLKRELDPLL